MTCKRACHLISVPPPLPLFPTRVARPHYARALALALPHPLRRHAVTPPQLPPLVPRCSLLPVFLFYGAGQRQARALEGRRRRCWRRLQPSLSSALSLFPDPLDGQRFGFGFAPRRRRFGFAPTLHSLLLPALCHSWTLFVYFLCMCAVGDRRASPSSS